MLKLHMDKVPSRELHPSLYLSLCPNFIAVTMKKFHKIKNGECFF